MHKQNQAGISPMFVFVIFEKFMHVYNEVLLYPLPYFSPTSFPQGPFSYFHPQPHFLLIFLNHNPLSPISAPQMCMRVSHPLEHGE